MRRDRVRIVRREGEDDRPPATGLRSFAEVADRWTKAHPDEPMDENSARAYFQSGLARLRTRKVLKLLGA